MPDLKMTLACWNHNRTRALMDGSVKPEDIDFTCHNSFPAATFHRVQNDVASDTLTHLLGPTPHAATHSAAVKVKDYIFTAYLRR